MAMDHKLFLPEKLLISRLKQKYGIVSFVTKPKYIKGRNLLLSYLTHPNFVDIKFDIVVLVYN